MKFFVESWAPEYGTPAEDAMAASTTEVEVHHEVAADQWAPMSPDPTTAVPTASCSSTACAGSTRALGRRRRDGLRQGVCASYAAGAVRCNGRAELVDARVERGVFCCGEGVDSITTQHATWTAHPATGEAPEQLWLAVQNRMADLEAKAAIDAGAGGDAGLVVVDGPLRDRRAVHGVVGYVKTHHVHYLDPGHEEVLAALRRASARRCSTSAGGSRGGRGTCGCRTGAGTRGRASCGARRRRTSTSTARGAAPTDRGGVAPVRQRAPQGPAGAAEPPPHRRPRTGAAPPPRRRPAARAGAAGGRLPRDEVDQALDGVDERRLEVGPAVDDART